MTLQPHSWAYTGEKHGPEGCMPLSVHHSTAYRSQDTGAI